MGCFCHMLFSSDEETQSRSSSLRFLILPAMQWVNKTISLPMPIYYENNNIFDGITSTLANVHICS
eukprot:11596998-Ditylum_brightwellii.AAC.1